MSMPFVPGQLCSSLTHSNNDIEFFLHTFPGEINPGMNLHAALEFPVIVHVQVPGLLITIEIPVGSIVYVRA